jgi:hypothetical protein
MMDDTSESKKRTKVSMVLHAYRVQMSHFKHGRADRQGRKEVDTSFKVAWTQLAADDLVMQIAKSMPINVNALSWCIGRHQLLEYCDLAMGRKAGSVYTIAWIVDRLVLPCDAAMCISRTDSAWKHRVLMGKIIAWMKSAKSTWQNPRQLLK